MANTSRTEPQTFSSIGVDIGKDVFHLVGFDSNGKVVLRRKIKRLAQPVHTFGSKAEDGYMGAVRQLRASSGHGLVFGQSTLLAKQEARSIDTRQMFQYTKFPFGL